MDEFRRSQTDLEYSHRILAAPEFQQRARTIVLGLVRRFGIPPLSADDVYQEVMLKLLNYIERNGGRIVKNWDGFLYITARNVILDLISKKKRLPIESLNAQIREDSVEQPGEDQLIETGLLLREFLKLLEDEERITLDCIIEGFTGAQMAARLGITREAAAQRISRLKKKLREHLFGTGGTAQAQRD